MVIYYSSKRKLIYYRSQWKQRNVHCYKASEIQVIQFSTSSLEIIPMALFLLSLRISILSLISSHLNGLFNLASTVKNVTAKFLALTDCMCAEKSQHLDSHSKMIKWIKICFLKTLRLDGHFKETICSLTH